MKVLSILKVTFPFSWVVKSSEYQAQDSKKESGKNQRKEYLIQMDHPCKTLLTSHLPISWPAHLLHAHFPLAHLRQGNLPACSPSMPSSQPAHRPLVHQSVCLPHHFLTFLSPPLLPISRPIFKLECRCLQHITSADNQTEKRKPNFHFFENRSSDLAGWLFIFLLCQGLPSLTNTFLKRISMKYF